MGFNIELFQARSPARATVGLLRVLCCKASFPEIEIALPKRGIGHRKIRVEADGSLEEGYGSDIVSFSHHGLSSQAVGLEGIKRRRGGFFNRRIVLLHRAERFAELTTQLCCCLRRVLSKLAPYPCRDFLLGEGFSAATVHRFETQDILAPKSCNRAVEHSRTPCPLTNLSGNVQRESHIRRLTHKPKRLLDALVRNETEERRLFELHGQPLPESPVEYRVARCVREIGQDNGVLLSQRMRIAGE